MFFFTFFCYLNNWHGRLVLEGVSRQVHLDGKQLCVLHHVGTLVMERGQSRHQSPELEDNVLDMLVVQQLQLHKHI